MSADGIPIEFDSAPTTAIASGQHIRRFEQIPDVVTMPLPAVEYLVPALGIARNTICLWTGPDGDGKTYLAQMMALAVSRGDEFLGMRCRQAPVLYVDLENPGYVVQDRMQALIEDGNSPIALRFWGTWLEIDQQPPVAGSELLLTICKETKPLLIVDPFRYFHAAEENDSTAMSGVMQYLRACAVYGCAVVILHHPAKTEGSTGRGSSAIRGACDLAFMHSLDREAGLITLKVDKNRLGACRTITVKADFEEGKFEMSDAPYITRRNDEISQLQQIIEAEPGLSSNAIWKKSAGQRNRVLRLLKQGIGNHWNSENGKSGSIVYFPLTKPLYPKDSNPVPLNKPAYSAAGTSLPLYQPLTKSLYPKDGTAGTGHSDETCTAVPTPLGVVHVVQVEATRKNLTACPHCGSFAVYPQADGKHLCQTCERTW